jgi:hypothetical protein
MHSLNRLARLTILVLGSAPLLIGAGQKQEEEWLSLCGQCMSPSVTSKSGIGTEHAVVEAKITRKDAAMWCGAWEPSDNPEPCIRKQMATPEAKEIYRASADCIHGRITSVFGETYSYAGIWTSDIGKGRSKWRGADNKIVGQDEASGGLAIADQWEVLCPGPFKGTVAGALTKSAPAAATAKPAPSAPAAKTSSAPPAPSTKSSPALAPSAQKPANSSSQLVQPEYSIGEQIEAKFAGAWVRGKVQGIRQRPGNAGLDYDVVLENGKRGVLPAQMLRKVAGGSANQ